MLGDMFKDVTSIALAIVGVAILYTLVNPQNKTSQVIGSAGQAFSGSLAAAMGGQVSGAGVFGGY